MVKGYLIPDPIIDSSITPGASSSDKQLFWDPEAENEVYGVIGPALKTELNKAPSFEFTVIPSNSHYNDFNRKKTIIFIYDNDELLFEGRVSSTSTDFYKQKKVSCEGAVAYLMDSLQPGDKLQDGTVTDVEDNEYHSEMTEKSTKETIEAHLYRFLTRHNKDVDWHSKITFAEVPSSEISGNANPKKCHWWEREDTSVELDLEDITQFKLTTDATVVSGKIYYSKPQTFKEIYLGVINAKSEEQEFDSSGYRTTWEAIESDLIERFGGYIQVRRGKSADGEDPECNYLDYLPIENLTGSTSNTMTFGENVIELTQQEDEDDEIFTILLPFGKEVEKEEDVDGKKKKVRDRMTVEDATNAVTTIPTDGKEISPYLDENDRRYIIVSPVALEKYGPIYRCMDFEDKETADDLYTRAVEYINDTCGFRNTYEVKAVDIHTTNPSARARTKLGDRVLVKSKWHDINDNSLYVKAAQYDLENPENDTFTIGFPYQEREDKKISSTVSNTTKGSNPNGGYGGGYGSGPSASNLDNYIKYVDGRLESHTGFISEVKKTATGNSTKIEQNGDRIDLVSDAIIGTVKGESEENKWNRITNFTVSPSGIQGIVQIQDDHGNKLVNHGNKLVNHESRIQIDEEKLQQFTGNMYVEEEDVTFAQVKSELLSVVDPTTNQGPNPYKNGWWEHIGTSAPDLRDPKQFKLSTDIEVKEGKIYYTKVVGKSSIIIGEGAGMYNEKDQTRYGLWDEGNLTAGVLCKRINDATYTEVTDEDITELNEKYEGNPSKSVPWWYELDSHDDYVRTTDPARIGEKKYFKKIRGKTQTQIIGDAIVIGAPEGYEGIDKDTKNKLEQYLGVDEENNLLGTVTEIASDVVVVNALFAKFLSFDDAEGVVLNAHLINTHSLDVNSEGASSEDGAGWITAKGIDVDDVTADKIGTDHIYIGEIGFGSYTGEQATQNLTGVSPGDIVVGFGQATYSGDTVKIPFKTAQMVVDGTEFEYITNVLSFDKPASLGKAVWSSGTGGNTLDIYTTGGWKKDPKWKFYTATVTYPTYYQGKVSGDNYSTDSDGNQLVTYNRKGSAIGVPATSSLASRPTLKAHVELSGDDKDKDGNAVAFPHDASEDSPIISAWSKYIYVDATDAYDDGRNAIGLSAAKWTYSGDQVDSGNQDSNTVKVSTTGKDVNNTETINLYQTVGTWIGTTTTVYTRKGTKGQKPEGEYALKSTVTVPVTDVTWENTKDREWKTTVTVGSSIISSEVKDFGGYFTDGIADAKGKFGLSGPSEASGLSQAEAQSANSSPYLDYGKTYMVYKTYDSAQYGSKVLFRTRPDNANDGSGTLSTYAAFDSNEDGIDEYFHSGREIGLNYRQRVKVQGRYTSTSKVTSTDESGIWVTAPSDRFEDGRSVGYSSGYSNAVGDFYARCDADTDGDGRVGLTYDQEVTVYASYVPEGQSEPVNVSGITVTAPSQVSSNVTVNDINIRADSITRLGTKPVSFDSELTKLPTVIKAAINNPTGGTWVKFIVEVKGTPKIYIMNLK